jgi:hypothetical protein
VGAPGRQEHAVAGLDAQGAQGIGEAIGEGSELGVGDVAALAVPPQPSQRDVMGPRTRRVSIDGLVGDVEPSARRAARRGPSWPNPR